MSAFELSFFKSAPETDTTGDSLKLWQVAICATIVAVPFWGMVEVFAAYYV